MEKHTILVTGGAGFIGHHLILALLAKGHEVVCIDNFNDYYDVSLKEARIKRFDGKVTVYRVDIIDAKALEEICARHTFTKIAHLAAQAGVRHSLTHPESYVQNNYVGSFNILECARKHGVRDLVLASTSSIYGKAEHMPTNEQDTADRPLSIYAASKRGMEILAANYASAFGMHITCLRFFTVYGPWGRPDMALFKFTKGILEGTPIDVYNNGDMNRDFTYVDDIVAGFVAALERPFPYEIINLGRGAPSALLHYIEIIEAELGKKAQKNMLPMQPGDVPATWADTTKAKTLLGVEAKVSVSEGVPRFVEWYRRYYGV